MSKEKSKRLTIGQFAALHKTTKKTLMWYDEIGLLKPAYVKENGYRYYSYQQSAMLETILILRELNISLPEIQSFMNQRSAETLEVLLDQKMNELQQTISHLKSVQNTLSTYKQNITSLMNIDLSEIRLIHKDGDSLVCVNSAPGLSFEKELELITLESKKYQLHSLHDTSYGSMISVEKLYQGKLDDYDALFIKIPRPDPNPSLHLQPSGTYLRAFCKGSWDKLPAKYQEILAYADQHALTLQGYAYETGINELVIDQIDDYITQIEIPVEAKQTLR